RRRLRPPRPRPRRLPRRLETRGSRRLGPLPVPAADARRVVRPRSGSKERARKTRRAAVALLRDLLPPIDDDVDPGAFHAPPRLWVSLQRKRSARPERENVRALALELLVRHLDELDAAIGEQLEQTYRRQP